MLAAILCACDDAYPGADIVVRDSAGVDIIENTIASEDVLARWSVADAPDLELTGAGTDTTLRFSRGTSALQLENGTVVVLDAGRYRLHLFDRRGRLVRSVGRAGMGVAEFRVPKLVPSQRSERVLVHDFLQRRFTRFDGAGEVEDTVHAMFTGASAIAAAGDRVLTFHSTFSVAGPPGTREMPAAYGIFDLATRTQDTIGRFPGGLHTYTLEPRRGVPSQLPVPFDVMPSAAAGTNMFYITPGRVPEVRAYDVAGQLRRVIRLLQAPRAVTRAAFDSAAEGAAAAYVREASTQVESATVRAVYAQMPVPPVRPAFDALVVDEPGWVWVRRYEPDRASHNSWLVFDEEGRARAAVDLPLRLEPSQIGRDYVLGSSRDSAGGTHVRRHPLARRR